MSGMTGSGSPRRDDTATGGPDRAAPGDLPAGATGPGPGERREKAPELLEDPLGPAFPGGRHDPWRRSLRLGMLGGAMVLLAVLVIVVVTPAKRAVMTTRGTSLTPPLRSALVHEFHLGVPVPARRVAFVEERGFSGGAVALRFTTDRAEVDRLLAEIGRDRADLRPGRPPYAVFRFHGLEQAWSMGSLTSPTLVRGTVPRPRHKHPWAAVTLVVSGPSRSPTVHLYATTEHDTAPTGRPAVAGQVDSRV
ncbi:MAG: hypothetical protein QOJ60_3218 [Actinomycetota bacterium]|jgi:hypothetical protein|nr:hypothetical protein [Actinomycetota bacterium]